MDWRYLNWPLSTVLALALFFPFAAHALPISPTTNQKVLRSVRKVQTSKTYSARIDAAEHLDLLLHKTDPDQMDDATVHLIAALLETHNDGVRYWVADSLGYFGLRAQFAVPKLLEILKETDCLVVDSSSALSIRPVLKLLGATPPPHRCDQYIFPKNLQ